jgi:hypothetical protein
MSVRTTHPVNINVDDELGRRDVTKKQTVVEGALEVAKDMLRCSDMWLTWVMDVKAHQLNYVDVRPGEGEVLERTVQGMVGSRLAHRGTHVGGDLGLSVHHHGVGFAIAHASALKDILSILVLLQQEVVVLLIHYDVEEVEEGTQVLHGKLPLEVCSGTL